MAAHLRRRFTAAAAVVGACGTMAACVPTIRVQVAPIQISAKLDADVRLRLDKEVQQVIQQNPNLF